MRALCTIAFILSLTGSVRAQVPEADPVAPRAAEEPVEELAGVDAGDSPIVGEESSEAIEEVVSAPTSAEGRIGRIERIESSGLETAEDDLPPSLRDEEAPPTFVSPAPRVRRSPWRGYLGVGTGLGFHLNPRDDFQQGIVAPAYLQLRGGVVLPGRGALRSGLQLGVSTNLSREGAYPGGVLALRQWVLVPSYVLRLGLDSSLDAEALPAWIATARVGVPIAVSPDVTVGAELALGAQYFARAGVAVFAELIYDVFVGGRVRDGSRSTHHLLALEVGLQFELEVLP